MMIETEDDFDPVAAGERHRKNHPKCEEWETLMMSYQRRIPGVDGEGTWAEMEQVFELGE